MQLNKQNVVGKGKFGLVTLAWDRVNEREVAIKVIEKKYMEEEQNVMVLNEIEILKKVSHPNVVELFEVVENKDNYFIGVKVNSHGVYRRR